MTTNSYPPPETTAACRCVPVTAAGEMVKHPECPQHGTPKFRIWVAHCAFKKNGFPSLGSFGYTTDDVVIFKMSTWKRLCEEIPALKTTMFEVGSHD